MILVYEHASRGSLDRHLNSANLTWKQRLSICLDAAKGLNHLHDPRETSQRLIHCDIKSANILLDDEWNAKVADFGLSKIAPANQQNSLLVTNALGTIGYCDPLFMETYSLTKESDVYSFGVVLFEVLCGRLCFEMKNGQVKVLVPMWKKSYQENKLDEIIFQDLRQQMDPTSLKTFSDIAFLCLKKSRQERPSMSLVVEMLEIALKCQEPKELQERQQLKKLLDAAVRPLIYTSEEELNELLSQGFLVNNGNTWISLNDKQECYEMISMVECVDFQYEYNSSSSGKTSDNTSRFPVGSYTTRGTYFTTKFAPQFLSPQITYTVNLIFKCPNILKGREVGKQRFISLTYKLSHTEKTMSLVHLISEKEKKISIVHLADKSGDEWLVARLYQFPNHYSIVDLEIDFESHENSLEVEGIEFQPMNINAMMEYDDQVLDEYQEILKSLESHLIYRSVEELKMFLSKGVLLNGGNTWFYLNDDGQHCEMITIKECLLLDPEKRYDYYSDYNSRFLVGTYYAYTCEFKIRARAQFLSPDVTYTVNLVFKFKYKEKLPKQPYIGLKYRLEGATKILVSYFANKREDDWWMLELCQFYSEGTTADIEINFEDDTPRMVVEGIEFLPLELKKAEHNVLKEMQPVSSDSVAYREQKVPNHYEDMIKLSKASVPKNTTNKELYLILSKGFLINDGQEWLFLEKKGKKCLMLSARAAVDLDAWHMKWQSLPESRFGETMELRNSDFKLISKIKSQVLSSHTTYATYLVYKLPEDQSEFETPLKVMDGKDLGSDSWEKADSWYVFIVSPQTPVINVRGEVDQNSRNPVNRPEIKDLPQQRSDGWMEVQVWEFQTADTTEMIPLHLKIESTSRLHGLLFQGVEFRPI